MPNTGGAGDKGGRVMLTVELLYDTNCPNVKDARAQLLRALAATGLSPHWQEWDRGAPESPSRVRAYGSPTILVNGQDVANASPSAGANCCRLYVDDGGQLRGVPSVEAITAALSRAKETMSSVAETAVVQKSSWLRTLVVLPVVGTALLPNLTCPACWPAYAGLFSAFGLGFVNYTPYLLPLTAVFLTLTVASLGHHAKTRRSYKSFVFALLAAVMVIVGKFVFV